MGAHTHMDTPHFFVLRSAYHRANNDNRGARLGRTVPLRS